VIQKKQNLIILFFLIFTFCKIVPLSAFDFYWEDTVNLSSGEGRFPQSSSGKNLNIVVWEDIEITGKDKGNIWLSAQIANNNENTWKTIKHFAGPYVYSGDVPNIFSVAINKKDVIAIAVKSASQQISSIVSSDGGHSFTSYDIFKTGESLIAPRIYQSANNTFTIFATGVADGSFHLNIARSSDGITWTPFSAFANSSSFTNAFLPTLQVVPTTSDTVITEKDVVVFQAFYRVGEKLSYQLYSTISDDNGITWTEPIIISQMVEANQTFDKFHNQRPNLSYIDNTLFLSWERSYFTSTDTAIYVVPLTSSGIFAETPTKISPANVEAHQPILLSVKDKLSVVWFDNRRGNNCVYFAQKNGYLWEDEQISSSSQTSVFACPVVINQGQDFHVF